MSVQPGEPYPLVLLTEDLIAPMVEGDESDEKRWISISNALTKAAHGVTLSEKRMIFLALSKIDSKRVPAYRENVVSIITAAEYAEVFDVDLKTAYNELQYSARNLYERSITFYEPERQAKVSMRWVGTVKYIKGEGRIELYWIPQLLEHIMGLTRHFTSYQLKQTTALRSIYAWKLLELLMKYKNTGWAEYDIEEFCIAMDATEKQKQNFANIRRRMIEPAVKELEEKDGWHIEWRGSSSVGKKIKTLRFTFTREPSAI